MKTDLSVIKGIHPGFVLERELRKRNLRKGPFAISLNEYPQTLVSITKGKRKMNTGLAMKIEKDLGMEEGYFMTLQVFYDIQELKRKKIKSQPDLSKLRAVLFWDTKIENIEWERQKKAVIQRVFERGNGIEKNEIIRFYGEEIINNTLKMNG
jgi:antitoxin HigA-1